MATKQAGPEGLDTPVRIEMTPRQSVEFLEKLATDDEFRSRLQKNPQEVLAENHIYLSPEQIPGKIRLAPKEVFQEAFEWTQRASDKVAIAFIPFASCHIVHFYYLAPRRPKAAKRGKATKTRPRSRE